jgi:two-component sensor histidine kinase
VLAVVQSLLHLAPPDEPKRYSAVMEARVMALSRAHMLLAERGWESAGLREVAEAGLSRAAPAADAVEMAGPDLVLSPTVVQPLALVIHELAANAAQGAGAAGPGQPLARLSWRLDPGRDLLVLDWRECGRPGGTRHGATDSFARRLVRALVMAQLRGTLDAADGPGGTGTRICLPASRCLAGGARGPAGRSDVEASLPSGRAGRIASEDRAET